MHVFAHRTARTALAFMVLVLLTFGLIMLYSTSYAAYAESMLSHQLTWVALGTVGAVVVWRLDYRTLGRYAWVALAAVALALGYLALAHLVYKIPVPAAKSFVSHWPLLGGGPTKGGFRWLKLGPMSIQPSEFAKPFLILFLADYFGRRSRYIHEFRRGFIKPMVVAGAIVVLIFLGRNLSITVITGAVVFSMAFVAGVRIKYLVLLGVLGSVLAFVALRTDSERMRRWLVFRDPEPYQNAEGYQLWASQLALGSGGLRGLGFTQSRMKQMYLPEAHTDFIVAIVGEELGYLAVLLLLAGYGLLMGAIFWIAALAADRQGALICTGVGLSIGYHAFVNISVVSGFCPTTGVTAPFLSYGGSSMMASLLGIGLVLSVSRLSEIATGQPDSEDRYAAGFGASEDEAERTPRTASRSMGATRR